MANELAEAIGRQVDLGVPGELSRYLRKQVVESAEPMYVRR